MRSNKGVMEKAGEKRGSEKEGLLRKRKQRGKGVGALLNECEG